MCDHPNDSEFNAQQLEWQCTECSRPRKHRRMELETRDCHLGISGASVVWRPISRSISTQTNGTLQVTEGHVVYRIEQRAGGVCECGDELGKRNVICPIVCNQLKKDFWVNVETYEMIRTKFY